MTTERYEIEFQGSDDGKEWRSYEFRHKPGDPARAPGFVAPHQPRADFQCWFLLIRRGDRAQFEGWLRDPECFQFMLSRNAWFANLFVDVLNGSASTAPLFAANPFPDAPPRYLRVRVHRYTMTNRRERREQGAYWNRELIAEWKPIARNESAPQNR